MQVSVLGMGRMGAAMASKLIEAGHNVTVWNRTQATAEAFAGKHGAQWAVSSADAVVGADLVIAMLASGAATQDILLEPATLAAVSESAIVCDMGTSGPEVAHTLAAGFKEAKRRFVDAPVSGSVPSVLSGQLLVLGSGVQSDVDQAADVLAAFAKRTVYLGPAGSGQTMKLCVNLIVHALNAAVSEGLALATAAGIDPESAYEVFANSSIAAPYVLYKRESFLNEATPVAMRLELVAKDLKLISVLASEHGLALATLAAITEQATEATAAGFGDADMAALVRYIRQSGDTS